MSEDRLSAVYSGSVGKIHIDFEPTAHQYGIGPNPEALDLVPSFSDIAEFLPKYLASWAQNCGVDGVLELGRRAKVSGVPFGSYVRTAAEHDGLDVPENVADPKFISRVLGKLGLDHNAVRDAAANRGTSIHSAFRGFIVNGFMPNPDDYEGEEVKGYITSLRMLCEALRGNFDSILCEEPICSPSLGVAGTPDLYCEMGDSRVQVGGNVGPGKRPKYETKSGKCLIDLKTSAQVYTSHKWQLSAYQRFLGECGFEQPATRAIVLIKKNGEGYNWKEQPLIPDDAIAALVRVWEAENRPEGWTSWSTEKARAAA